MEQHNSPPCHDGHQHRPQTFLRVLGPGLVTGAADDDPSGIVTYSQVGAQFGYSLGWTMLFSYPLMAAMQGVSAGIGVVTGQGIAQNLRRHYSPWLLRGHGTESRLTVNFAGGFRASNLDPSWRFCALS